MIKEYATPPEKVEQIQRTAAVEEEQSVKKSWAYEKKKLSGMTTKKKIEYLVTYYGLKALVAIVMLAVLISLIHHLVTYQKSVLDIIVCSGTPENQLQVDEDFREFASLSRNEKAAWEVNLYEHDMQDNPELQSELHVLMLIQAVDVLFISEDQYDFVKDTNGYADPDTILREDQLQALAPYREDNFFKITDTRLIDYLGLVHNCDYYYAVSNLSDKNVENIIKFTDLLIEHL